MSDSRIIVALDFANAHAALACADQLDPNLCHVKVGKELFTRAGPEVVRALHAAGFKVFLDLKYHDIPNTVAKAVLAACELGVWMLNVHAQGGQQMLTAAVDAVAQAASAKPKLIAVTMLTSLSDADLAAVGLQGTVIENAQRLAQLSHTAGLDGVVCSAQEAAQLKELCGQSFLTVTPGIRLSDSKRDDQQRIMTPAAAIANGADFLVIGRPITQADDPLAALQTCRQQITQKD